MAKKITPGPVVLGDKVRDKITGFTGIAIARTLWLHGCDRLVVQPQELKDGKTVEAQSFDEAQVEVLERGTYVPQDLPVVAPAALARNAVVEEPPRPAKRGGPRPEPQRAPDPKR